MARDPKTPDQLRAASDHLFYEVWMLRDLPQCLTSEAARSLPLQNAVLESFTIHARILVDFLYPEKPWKTDVLAEDFFDDPEEWNRLRPAKAPVLDQVNSRVGKEIAHLTYDRQDVTPEAKQWPIPEIAREILVVADLFLSAVPPGLLGIRWRNAQQPETPARAPTGAMDGGRAQQTWASTSSVTVTSSTDWTRGTGGGSGT